MKRYVVEVRQNRGTGHPLSWPVVLTKHCWTRTGAHLFAGRFGPIRGVHTRITNLKEIS